MKEYNELFVVALIECGFLIAPIFFMAFDFVSGVRKAKKRGEAITSEGWRRTFDKAQRYYIPLLALSVADALQVSACWYLNTFKGYNLPTFPFITLFGDLCIFLTEVKSMLEPADAKEKKQLNNIAALASELAKHRTEPSELAKLIADFMTMEEKNGK